MNHERLINEFTESLNSLQRTKHFKQMLEGMHGGSFVLMFIGEQTDGDVTPSDISVATGLSTARIAAALGNLESKELITREIDTQDRRRIIVRLTNEGRKLVETVKQQKKEFFDYTLSELGEEDAREYLRITKRLVEIACGLDER